MKYFFIILTTLFLLSCISREFDLGKFENGTYSNEFFGFSIDQPEGWYLQSSLEQEELINESVNYFAQNSNNSKSSFKSAQERTISLFSFFKYNSATGSLENPSIICTIEKLPEYPRIRDEKEYLAHAMTLFEKGPVKYKVLKESFKNNFSGVTFYTLSISYTINSIDFNLDYHVIKKNQYILTICAGYNSDISKKEIFSILSNIRKI